MKDYLIKTKRLGLRNWNLSDLKPFSKICQDKEVMKYFPKLHTEDDSLDFIKRMQTHYQTYGFCYFAVDVLKTNDFIGFTGMLHQNYKSHFTPCIDIGWRLKKESWGKGYATEAAKACLNFAELNLDLKNIYAIASLVNNNSIAVMKRIGMNFDSEFQHPSLLNNSILKDCVVYSKNFSI